MRRLALFASAFWFIAGGSISGCSSTPATASQTGRTCTNKVEIGESERTDTSVEIGVRNLCHVPLTIDVTFDPLNNLTAEPSSPITLFVPAQGRRPVSTLRAIDPRLAWGYRIQISSSIGRSPATPDRSFRYAFPFGGTEARQCVQGANGALSHSGKHAFDFDMPVGTPVLAARAGIVYRIVDGFPDGGLENRFKGRANKVVVLHDDGTIATYTHLRNGVVANEGRNVEQGQMLGYSGNSGYSTAPHLHFEVGIESAGTVPTISIRFSGDEIPSKGHWYEPGATRE